MRRYLGENPGEVIELETGKKIGEHKGLWFHTIGQRKGLGLGGGPWFVIKKDVERNVLYVSHGYDPQDAYKQEFVIHGFDFLTEGISELPERVTFKIRHTPEHHGATVVTEEDGRYRILSDDKIHGVAPGQFWNYYSDNVTWPAALPFTCDMLWRQFGNRQPIDDSYPTIRKWVLHMIEEYCQNGIITKDKYGDWCPPEYPSPWPEPAFSPWPAEPDATGEGFAP